MYQPKLGRFMSRDPMPENGITVLSPVPDMRKYYKQDEEREHEYVYAQNNPINRIDSSGLCSVATLNNALALVNQNIQAAASLPFVFPLHPNNPHQHCVWNCRMTRVNGPFFAAQYSLQKEVIDNAFANLRDSLQADGCWCYLPLPVRRYVQDSADSAFQLSDFFDNAAGIACGLTICHQGTIYELSPRHHEKAHSRPFGRDRYGNVDCWKGSG